MNANDLDAVVAIHQEAFKGFFLTRMGPRFLRAYYNTVLDFGGRIAIIGQDPDSSAVLGFAVGFQDPQGFYQLFGQRRKRMIPTIMLAILRDPGLLPQIIRNMRRVESQAQQSNDAVELSSIAVGASGRGVGGELLSTFMDKVREKGAHKVILTTDAQGNDLVRKFYEARGFILDGIETRGARQLCRYVRELG
jgi:GNAT superfamily N-acetyltransferase